MEKTIDWLGEVVLTDQPAKQFIAALQKYATESRTANHPLLLAISQGSFKDLQRTIRIFLSEYYFYSHKFTRYLGAVMSSLESPVHRVALVGNNAEEAGQVDAHHRQELAAHGINPDHVAAPHPELFRRFLSAIGINSKEILARRPLVSTVAWSETFHDICRYSGQGQAVGALGIATEGIVAKMYGLILEGIHRAWPTMSAYERAFFDLHAMVDDDHAEVLREIAASLSETVEGRWQIALGVVKALDTRGAFFDYMFDYLREKDQTDRRAA